jgi:hypothetical protein
MKKILLTIAMAATSTLLFAQGSIVFENTGSANGNYVTNVGLGTVSLTPTGTAAPSAYYYTLLVAAYGSGAPADNPTAPAWSQAIIANPGTAQGQLLLGHNYLTAGSFAAQLAANYTTISGSTASADEYVLFVGWSSNEGNTWQAVYNQLTGSGLASGGFFGYSPVGTALLGPTGGPGVSMFASGSGITGGITLMSTTTIPEPSTLALAGLGSLSLLLFRRRK